MTKSKTFKALDGGASFDGGFLDAWARAGEKLDTLLAALLDAAAENVEKTVTVTKKLTAATKKYLSGLDELRRYPGREAAAATTTTTTTTETLTGGGEGLREAAKALREAAAELFKLIDDIDGIYGKGDNGDKGDKNDKGHDNAPLPPLPLPTPPWGTPHAIPLPVELPGPEGAATLGARAGAAYGGAFGSVASSALSGALAQTGTRAQASFSSAGQAASSAFASAFSGVPGLLSGVFAPLSALSASLGGVGAVVRGSVLPAVVSAKAGFSGLFDGVLAPGAAMLGTRLAPAASSAVLGVSKLLSGMKTTLSGTLGFLGGSFLSDWGGAWGMLRLSAASAFSGIAGGIKAPVNGAIAVSNKLISAVVEAVNAVGGALSRLSFSVPDWVPGLGGSSFGINIGRLEAPEIPYLAKGAVIPPRSPFAAVLGDQSSGVNIETPEALLRKIMREELPPPGGGSYRFTAELDRRTIFDEVISEARLRQGASGKNPFMLP